MTAGNLRCHHGHVRVRSRGARSASRCGESANSLAGDELAYGGRPYPAGFLEKPEFLRRPRNWPVWSPVVSTRKRLILFALLLAAVACGKTPAPPSNSQPQRGGEIVASLRSEPGN